MLGYSNDKPKINTIEVDDFKWISLEKLNKDLVLKPEKYTAWFLIIFERFYKYVLDNNLSIANKKTN